MGTVRDHWTVKGTVQCRRDGSAVLKKKLSFQKKRGAVRKYGIADRTFFAWIDGSGFPYAKNLVNASVRIGNLSE